jgi:phenylacetate-CoA ligase
MSIREKAYRYLLYPLYSPGTFWDEERILGDLLESGRKGRTGVEAIRDAKLQALFAHLSRNVPFYAGRVEGSIAEGRVPRISDLESLPVITKPLIRENREALLSRDSAGSKSVEFTTGGSTGEPLRAVTDWNSLLWSKALLRRGHAWAGLRAGDRRVALMGVGHVTRLGAVRERLVNEVTVIGFGSTPEARRAQLRAITKARPRSVQAYPSALAEIARDVLDSPAESPPTGFSIALCTGEMLYASQRELIREAFGAEAFQYYGSNEIGSIAYECESHRLHICEEHVLVEAVDEAGHPVTGKPGRLLITDLDNLVMPFVRYQIGDVGTLSEEACPCGRSQRVLASLEGRIQDRLVSPEGRTLPAIFFPHRFRSFDAIDKYQIVQERPEKIVVHYIPKGEGAPAEVQLILSEIRAYLGGSVELEARPCREIHLTARGKTRLVVGLG